MEQDVSFERDIRPLWRERDVSSMLSVFDLSSYDDVHDNAEAIYERLADGTMPCDGAWQADDVNRFAESNESNNDLSQSITIGGSGLPDLILTSLSYSNGLFQCTAKNQGSAAVTSSGAAIRTEAPAPHASPLPCSITKRWRYAAVSRSTAPPLSASVTP